MKFAKYLHAESVPEWRKKYIDYKGLKKAIKRAHQAKVSASQQPQLQEQQQEPSSSSSVVGVSVKRFSQRDQQRTSLDVGRIDRHYGTLNEHNTSSLPRDPHTNDVNDLTSTSSQNSAQPPKETDVAPVHSNVPPSKAVAFDTPTMTQDNPSVSRQPLLPSASVASASASSSVVAIAAAKEVMTPVPMAARRKHFRNFSTQSGMRMLRRVSTSFGWPLAPLDQVNEDKSHSRQPSHSKDEIAPISKMTPEEAERALSMILLGCTQEEIDFFDMLNAELEMVEQFYKENEVKLVERLELLQKQCEMVVAYENKQITSANLPISLTAAPSPRNMESGVIPLTVSLTDEMRASTSNGIITRLQTANVGYLRQLGNAWHPSPSPTPSINTEREAITASLSEEHRIENQAKAAKRRIRKALLEFYRNIRLLQNYRALNQTGFVKILKKFDKMTGNECKELYLKKMEDYKFNQPVNLQTTQGRAEELFTKYFEDGSRRRAMQLLRLPTEETHSFRAPTFRFGLYLGLGIPALLYALHSVLNHGAERDSLDSRLLQIFSSFFLPVLFMLLFAVNVRAWTRYHVNYKFIFEVDPRDHLHFYQFLEFPGVFFVIFAYCLAFAMTDPWPNVLPARYFPAIFILIILTLLFLPFKVLYHSARRWSIIVATRIIFSGLFNVQFRDFFIADELCSLIYLFTMLQLTACTYATNWDELGAHCDYQRSWLTPFIAVLPPFWRLMQCIRRYHDSKAAWPHLANALKYSGTISVAFLAAAYRITQSPIWNILWLIVSVLVTGYATFWDLYMDWGFFQPNSKNRFLRDELVFPYKSAYYFAMGSDLFLRAAWLLNISPSLWGIFYDHRIVAFVLAVIEILRRFQWNFYRMENEHVNNCGNFRAIREIPLPFAVDSPTKQIPRGELASQALHNTLANEYKSMSHSLSASRRASYESGNMMQSHTIASSTASRI